MVLFFTVAAMQAKTQIVYVDIEPDTTIEIPNVTGVSNIFEFDINNDSIIDYAFLARNINLNPQERRIWIRNFQNQNKLTGCCSGGYYYPLYNNDTVSTTENWFGIMDVLSTETMVPFTCYPPIGDFYVGLKFIVASDTLFGWVRCSATDSNITIKEYAYNTIPNLFILAGQTVLDSSLVPLFPEPAVFMSQNQLVVALGQYPLPQGEIRIANNMGQIVKSVPIESITNYIPITGIAQGLYIIQIDTPQGGITKKVFLQEN
ncbi:MAG: T9SS type A sorting domain-containing protein [Bacteroidales bacterium]|nr:T9SS type A sorting domain-containing protein [Bacteroidales bacterium]